MGEDLLSIEIEIEVPAGCDPEEVKQRLADVLRLQFPGVVDISMSVHTAGQPPGED